MASNIRIHQDIFKVERRKGGLTTRNILWLAIAAVVAVALTFLLWQQLRLPFELATTIAVLLAVIPICIGFVPIYGMPFEQAAAQMAENYLSPAELTSKEAGVEIEKGVYSREYLRAKKKPGFERDYFANAGGDR